MEGMREEGVQMLCIEDVLQSASVSGLCADPDNGCLYYCLRTLDAADKQLSEVHRYCMHDCSHTRLTHGHADSLPSLVRCDAQPCLYFLRDGAVLALPLQGGESVQVTRLPLPILSFKLGKTADKQVFVVACVAVRPSLGLSSPPSPPSSGRLFDQPMVRHWNAWSPGDRRHHLFYVRTRVDRHGMLTQEGEPTDLMQDLPCDCPAQGPSFQHGDFDVSADGRLLLCFRPAHTPPWVCSSVLHQGDLNLLGKAAPFSLAVLVQPSAALLCSNPCASPGGLTAYLRNSPEAEQPHSLWVVSDGEHWCAVDEPCLSLRSVVWLDDRTLLARAAHAAVFRVLRIRLDVAQREATVQVLAGECSRLELALLDGHLALVSSSLRDPCSLLLLPLAAAEFAPFAPAPAPMGVRALSEDEDARSDLCVLCCNPCMGNGDVSLATVHELRFPGANDDPVHAWFLAPDDGRDPTRPASRALVVIAHGGPHGCVFNAWSSQWNLQWYAAQGYAVLAVNFHGSVSFGTDFSASVRDDWGGKPYEDIMLGVDFALASFPCLDPARVAVLGASYGGYMAHWINGQTDRFRCLVSMSGVFSLESMAAQTDEQWFLEREFGPWAESEDALARWSPARYARRWTTPCLVIHGARDFRVPETEGLAAFNALQRRGVRSQLLHFPDEGHWVLRPANSRMWHRTVADWLAEHLTEDVRVCEALALGVLGVLDELAVADV